MKNIQRFIIAVVLTGSLVGMSAVPAAAARKSPKVTDSAAILNLASVGANAIKSKNFKKLCQMLTPTSRKTFALGGKAGCAKMTKQWFATIFYAAPWTTELVTYLDGSSAKVTMGKGSSPAAYDAKIDFTLNYSNIVWTESWGFKKMRGRAACYQRRTPCWRVAFIIHRAPPT